MRRIGFIKNVIMTSGVVFFSLSNTLSAGGRNPAVVTVGTLFASATSSSSSVRVPEVRQLLPEVESRLLSSSTAGVRLCERIDPTSLALLNAMFASARTPTVASREIDPASQALLNAMFASAVRGEDPSNEFCTTKSTAPYRRSGVSGADPVEIDATGRLRR